MTLRVRIDIDPYGDTSKRYPIYDIAISNMKKVQDEVYDDLYLYDALVREIVDGNCINEGRLERIKHLRSEGAIVLTHKVLDAYMHEYGATYTIF